MKDPQGTIVEIVRDSRGVTAIVDVDAEAVCARCASGRGCGAGIFGARTGRRRIDIAVGKNLELGEGDMIVYGLPRAGAAAAAALAFAMSLGDAGAATMALGGLAGGVLIGRRRLRDDACLARFTPVVSRRIAPDL
jgi:sigma-E factor negative regulatory protein RseC